MIWLWTGFVGFVLAMLALDLGVFHRKAHVVSVKEALGWSAFWISLGLLFSVFVYFGYENHWLGLGATVDAVDGVVNDGGAATLKYLTGYVVEKSLSVDNVFVIAMIFGFFAVPPIYQHRVLFWGILGALVMRGAMIALGAELIAEFHWILYVFGAFLILTGDQDAGHEDRAHRSEPERRRAAGAAVLPGHRPVPRRALRGARRDAGLARERAAGRGRRCRIPSSTRAKPGTLLLTPLALALVMVETTDLIFAVDSIPAIFAITADPFLVFTSNVFAILGLRSLYFALAGMLDKFRYLKVALAVVLMVVGVKMLIAEWLKGLLGEYFNFYLLALVLLILAARRGVLAGAAAGAEGGVASVPSTCPQNTHAGRPTPGCHAGHTARGVMVTLHEPRSWSRASPPPRNPASPSPAPGPTRGTRRARSRRSCSPSADTANATSSGTQIQLFAFCRKRARHSRTGTTSPRSTTATTCVDAFPRQPGPVAVVEAAEDAVGDAGRRRAARTSRSAPARRVTGRSSARLRTSSMRRRLAVGHAVDEQPRREPAAVGDDQRVASSARIGRRRRVVALPPADHRVARRHHRARPRR